MSHVLLVHGEARQIPLADQSCHCIVTSPPFWGLRDYQVQDQLGLEALHDCAGAFTGEQCVECFVCHLRQVARELWRVLRDDGTFWMNLGDSYTSGGRIGHGTRLSAKQRTNRGMNGTNDPPRAPQPVGLTEKNLIGIPWRVALALQADGWTLRSAITWCKSAPMPESVQDRPTSATEMVFLLTKHPTYFFDAEAVREYEGSGWHGSSFQSAYAQETKQRLGKHPRHETPGRNLRNFWVLGPHHYAGAHFATFPTALVERCLKAGTSEAGCCTQCRAPWIRQVERIKGEAASYNGSSFTKGKTHEARAPLAAVGQGPRTAQVLLTGWAPSCACEAGAPMPCVALDPFVGSGTTLLVARALGRDGVGMDLSYSYLYDQARTRLQLDALAAWEGRNGHHAPGTHSDLPLFAGGEEPNA